MKKVVDLETITNLRKLVRVGKARVVKEFIDGEPEIFVRSPSGILLGHIGQKYKYMFEAVLIEKGSGDALLKGFDQTTAP